MYLKKLNENKESVALGTMDIMIPVMGGYATITKIRQQCCSKYLLIIALTVKAMQKGRNKCIEVGANDYHPKSVDIDNLLSLLRVWLGIF
jgi:two-component system chemotaxis sensor kinase CheA